MPKHNSSIFLLLILLAVQSIAEEKEKQKLDSNKPPDNEDSDSNDIRSSAITIIEAPDLSNPPLREDDEDGISNILSEKTLSAIDILTAIPGEAWVQKFLSQVETDNDYGDESDDTDLELEESEEMAVELTAEQIEGKQNNLVL